MAHKSGCLLQPNPGGTATSPSGVLTSPASAPQVQPRSRLQMHCQFYTVETPPFLAVASGMLLCITDPFPFLLQGRRLLQTIAATLEVNTANNVLVNVTVAVPTADQYNVKQLAQDAINSPEFKNNLAAAGTFILPHHTICIPCQCYQVS